MSVDESPKEYKVPVINPGGPILEEDQAIICARYQRSQHQMGRRYGTGTACPSSRASWTPMAWPKIRLDVIGLGICQALHVRWDPRCGGQHHQHRPQGRYIGGIDFHFSIVWGIFFLPLRFVQGGFIVKYGILALHHAVSGSYADPHHAAISVPAVLTGVFVREGAVPAQYAALAQNQTQLGRVGLWPPV